MLKKCCLSVSVAFILASCYRTSLAQSVKQYVRENTKEVFSSLDLDADLGDLKVIGEAIGDSWIVMLGEQSHGDGSTFLTKSRLIKYLHEAKGFNVLAFESDYFALTNGWSTIPSDSASIKRFLQYNVFPVWSFSEECKMLFYNYIPKTQLTNNAIQIAGIDPQMHGEFTKKHLKSGLKDFFNVYQSDLAEFKQEQNDCLSLIDSVYSLNHKRRPYLDSLLLTDFKNRLAQFRASVKTIYTKLPENAHSSEYSQALKNLVTFSTELLEIDNEKSTYARDERMSENLKWLLKYKYPNEKIIVWAANRHIMKNSLHAFKKLSSNTGSFGTSFTADSSLAKQTYILGVTSFAGSSQTVLQSKSFEIRKPKNGFESWLPADMQFGFLNMKTNNADPERNALFTMKARGHSAIEAKWFHVFDGILYIRDMKPAHVTTK